MNKKEIKAELKKLNAELEIKQSELENKQKKSDNFELDPYDYEDQYCDMLNEVYGDAEIAGMKISTDYALRELDPTAYRCGLIDYVDSLELNKEDDKNYKELQEEIETLESEIDDIKEQIDDLESELND